MESMVSSQCVLDYSCSLVATGGFEHLHFYEIKHSTL